MINFQYKHGLIILCPTDCCQETKPQFCSQTCTISTSGLLQKYHGARWYSDNILSIQGTSEKDWICALTKMAVRYLPTSSFPQFLLADVLFSLIVKEASLYSGVP